MSRLYVYQKIEKLVRRHGTRDPFELLDAMHVSMETSPGKNSGSSRPTSWAILCCTRRHLKVPRSLTRLSMTSAAARNMRPICSRRICSCGMKT